MVAVREGLGELIVELLGPPGVGLLRALVEDRSGVLGTLACAGEGEDVHLASRALEEEIEVLHALRVLDAKRRARLRGHAPDVALARQRAPSARRGRGALRRGRCGAEAGQRFLAERDEWHGVHLAALRERRLEVLACALAVASQEGELAEYARGRANGVFALAPARPGEECSHHAGARVPIERRIGDIASGTNALTRASTVCGKKQCERRARDHDPTTQGLKKQPYFSCLHGEIARPASCSSGIRRVRR